MTFNNRKLYATIRNKISLMCSSQMNFIKAFVLEWNISFKMLYTSVNNVFFKSIDIL